MTDEIIGQCPECGDEVKTIWDRVSDDPVRDEIVGAECINCEWKDE